MREIVRVMRKNETRKDLNHAEVGSKVAQQQGLSVKLAEQENS
jgi:hypothetical protein